ncbi:MAG: hypothetical protein Q3976_05670 [Corynebacterium sp.]|nr:hypothetical protein [Corynebacterium sp.]
MTQQYPAQGPLQPSTPSQPYGQYPIGSNPNPPVPEGKNVLAAWALGFAIISVLCVISIGLLVLAFVPAIITIVLAAMALKKLTKNEYESPRKGMAIVALCLGSLAALASVLAWIFVLPAVQACDGYDDSRQMQECISNELTS